MGGVLQVVRIGRNSRQGNHSSRIIERGRQRPAGGILHRGPLAWWGRRIKEVKGIVSVDPLPAAYGMAEVVVEVERGERAIGYLRQPPDGPGVPSAAGRTVSGKCSTTVSRSIAPRIRGTLQISVDCNIGDDDLCSILKSFEAWCYVVLD